MIMPVGYMTLAAALQITHLSLCLSLLSETTRRLCSHVEDLVPSVFILARVLPALRFSAVTGQSHCAAIISVPSSIILLCNAKFALVPPTSHCLWFVWTDLCSACQIVPSSLGLAVFRMCLCQNQVALLDVTLRSFLCCDVLNKLSEVNSKWFQGTA